MATGNLANHLQLEETIFDIAFHKKDLAASSLALSQLCEKFQVQGLR